MWLIVGLGNPGSRYLLTRHNLGFMAVDFLVKAVGVRNEDAKDEFEGRSIEFRWDSEPVKLLKPETYMNLSGKCIGELIRYYKIDLEHVLIVHDEIDLPFGRIQIKKEGGDGGHNGVKSIIENLGTNSFMRLRLGVGRPAIAGMDPASWVLQNFSKDEQEKLTPVLERSLDAIEAVVFDGVLKAMNEFNKRTE